MKIMFGVGTCQAQTVPFSGAKGDLLVHLFGAKGHVKVGSLTIVCKNNTLSDGVPLKRTQSRYILVTQVGHS